MDRFDCSFIEQPLHQDDILEHNKLSNIIKTPICLDESLKSKRVAERLIEIDGPKIWNIKIQRVGGLYEALKFNSLASKYNIEVWEVLCLKVE